MLIDCDVHVGYDSLLDLLPYLDGPTRELVQHSGTNGLGMPSYPWYHPSGWLRKDAYDPDAGRPGQADPRPDARQRCGGCCSIRTTSPTAS